MRHAISGLLLGALAVVAQDKNPFHGKKDAIEAGQGQFRIYCGPCHGIKAEGGRGPDLTLGTYSAGNSDDDLFRVISDGVTGTEMPGYSATFDTEGVWRLVAYIRSVAGKPAPALNGNRANGERLFWGKGGCGGCHRVGARGGRMGPELSLVGRQRSVAYLRESVVAPDVSLTPGYATVRVELKDGRKVVGVQKGYDAFSAQLIDAQENFHSYLREEVRTMTREMKSLMPGSYGRQFSDAELTDLVVYMAGLRGGATGSANKATGGIDRQRLQAAQGEPGTWLLYGKNYAAWRYAESDQINASNVGKLAPAWSFQSGVSGKFETTPIVDKGLMYITGPSNHAWALDLKTGRPFWHHSTPVPKGVNLCCGQVNRGFAALGDRLFKVTVEAGVVALDAKTGKKVWETKIDEYKHGYSATVAPLAIKGLVIVGIAGAEFGTRGFLDAYDAETGKRVWRFWTVPAPGEPGGDTWGGNDSWKRGGGSTWITGSYDPELNVIYWGTGNPGPDFNGDVRPGDNLYTCALVALDADTGKLKWHYQFTPHDVHDWDATSDPVLLDLDHQGRKVKAVMMANRNGYYYALDRTNGKLLAAKAYTKVSWADGINLSTGKPNLIAGQEPTEEGNRSCPTIGGGHNWQATAYSPMTNLYYFNTTDGCQLYYKYEQEYVDGLWYQASTVGPIAGEPSSGSIVALKPATGDVAWRFELTSGPTSGLLATKGNLVFGGDREGYVFALDALTGKVLWRYQTGGVVIAPPITYEFGGRQYIAVAAGASMMTFALP
jgi:alcohol dehydrogenase (cytochrome c)